MPCRMGGFASSKRSSCAGTAQPGYLGDPHDPAWPSPVQRGQRRLSSPLTPETTAAATPDYWRVMYLHRLPIGMVGLAETYAAFRWAWWMSRLSPVYWPRQPTARLPSR